MAKTTATAQESKKPVSTIFQKRIIDTIAPLKDEFISSLKQMGITNDLATLIEFTEKIIENKPTFSRAEIETARNSLNEFLPSLRTILKFHPAALIVVNLIVCAIELYLEGSEKNV
ncbi:MAG TPA: hypothetical protein VK184_25660 [Nostocaceae cyanobacterium]|nr:hypothetical protein [Nostocaceae cyanobacterium]